MSWIDSIVDRDGLAALPRLLSGGSRGARALQALLVVAAAGAVALVVAFARGHHVMGTTSEIPWGVLIATYVFFVVSSTGLCLVSSLGHVFGFAVFQPIAKKAIFLALVTLLVGFTVIASELEAPLKLAIYAVLTPNPRSTLWWMGALYAVYMVLISIELFFLFREDHRRARVAGVLGVIAALAAHSNLGAVFGLLHGRPFWYGPLLPIYFIASALMCGAALLILVIWVGDHLGNQGRLRPEHEPLMAALGKLLALFVGIVAFFTVWKIITAVAGGHGHKLAVTMASLTGPLFVSFWLFEVFLGVALPLFVLLGSKRRDPRWLAFASAALMVSVFVMRYNFVVAGQMFSLKPTVGHLGETLHYAPPFRGDAAGFLPYTPSIVEVLIVAGAIAAATLAYVGGARVLRLAPREATS
jgi:molybdopterin-containing oxidoreductase family membrane subunit